MRPDKLTTTLVKAARLTAQDHAIAKLAPIERWVPLMSMLAGEGVTLTWVALVRDALIGTSREAVAASTREVWAAMEQALARVNREINIKHDRVITALWEEA